jgi:hypothetical protein
LEGFDGTLDEEASSLSAPAEVRAFVAVLLEGHQMVDPEASIVQACMPILALSHPVLVSHLLVFVRVPLGSLLVRVLTTSAVMVITVLLDVTV